MIDTNSIKETWEAIRDAVREEDYNHHYNINESEGLPVSYLLLKEALFKYYGQGYTDGKEPTEEKLKGLG